MGKPRSNNKRDLILDAAVRLATQQGAAHLTLDAVAKKAKVGKGGLLYHFPTKLALLQAMVMRAQQNYQQGVQEVLTDLDNPHDVALAHVRFLTSSGKRLRQLSTIIIAVAVHYPQLLQPLRSGLTQRYENILTRPGGDDAILAMLAINGLFLMECLKVGPVVGENRKRVTRELLRLATGRPRPKK